MDKHLALPVGTTLDRFIMRKQEDFPYASGELSQLLRDVALGAKVVNREVNRAGLAEITGAFGNQNVQGEDQMKLDVAANHRFKRCLTNGKEVCAIISEEEEEIIYTGNDKGRYVVAMDPLDGSSNIDINGPIGTIFSIYRRVSEPGTKATMADVLQPGSAQVAAGYVLYGPSTMLVYTTGRGVNGFTYESSLGEFFLSHPNMRIPEDGKIYSCNEGSFNTFPEPVREYITACKERQFTARYIGALVADFHRSLLKGGIYLYPSTEKAPNGKLRLLYEGNCLAFIAEQAGGRATDGKQRIMDIEPKELHQRMPLFIGSKNMVDEVEKMMQQHSA